MNPAMEPLATLIGREPSPEDARVNTPTVQAIDAPLAPKGNAATVFEIAVFNALLRERSILGIKQVSRCRNVRIDGLLELDGGQRLAVEVKYRMNWEKACQACAQVIWFNNYPPTKQYRLDAAIVVFEEFTGDWARRKSSWLLENGWNYWLTDHREADGVPVRLVRFRDDAFESYEMAYAAAAAAAASATSVTS